MTTAPPNVRFPGLSPAEVVANRAEFGANVLTPPKRDPWWVLWFAKFEDPVIRILVVAAALQIAVGAYKGEYVEGLAIVVAILLATTIAFVNEYQAGREFDVLNRVSDDVPVKAIRGGEFVTVPKRDLVVGDVILVEIGEEIPADGVVLAAVSLSVSEASLTGEAGPVEKGPASPGDPPEQEDAYPPHQVLRGTLVADGHAVVRIDAVGDATELGRLGQKAGEESGETTPLNEQLDRLAKAIGGVGLAVAGATFFALVARVALRGELQLTVQQWAFAGILLAGLAVGLHRVWLKILLEGLGAFGVRVTVPEVLAEDTLARWGVALALGVAVFGAGLAAAYLGGGVPGDPADWMPRAAGSALLNAFMVAVVIIVVAVPEGLAMSVTLSLAYSMRKMTAQNTLVRKLHACETIGAATVICSDKTGTLTQNRMTVVEANVPGVAAATDAMAVNSTAHLSREGGGLTVLGNPTEGAMLVWLAGQGVDYLAARSKFAVTAQLPFSTERKVMATAGRDAAGRTVLHVKGAPEVVLAACDRVLRGPEPTPLTPADRDDIAAKLTGCQARGMRTIGLGFREGVGADADLAGELHGLVWLGFAALADPVRPEVPEAIAACRRAGIRVKIVTGDTPDTAREIGRQIGLLDGTEPPGRVLTGRAFAALGDADAAKAAQELLVLARARPLDKLRLVRLLQDQREVVAVTGDGTNDAPALNHAKVGLAMGITGTAVAKEAADVVLLDDSFGSIVTAVKWGRGLYENIQRFILFQLTINVAALGLALAGPFAGVNFPLTVMQMLWVNLIMDTFAALALATEPPTDRVLNRPPRRPEDFIVTPAMARRVVGTGGAFLALMLGLLLVMPRGPGGEPETAEHREWLTLFFCGFVLLQFWNLFNARAFGTGGSAFAGLGRNPAFLLIAAVILGGQILLVQFGGEVFRTVPLTAGQWVALVAVTSPVLIVGEFARFVGRLRR